MLEKPTIQDEEISNALHTHFGITPSNLTFLPLGYDSAAWVYQVTSAGGQRYFLKVRRGGIHTAAPSLAHYLQQQGMEWVVAPIPTASGHLIAPLETNEDYSLLLYPWLDGRTGMPVEGGLSAEQWMMYGDIVRQLHAARLPAELANGLPVENFVLRHNWGNFIRELGATIEQRTNPIEREFAALWQEHLHEILHIVEQAEFTGNLLRRQPANFVVCHADIHTANLLVTPDGRLHVVDWDRPLLAPKDVI